MSGAGSGGGTTTGAGGGGGFVQSAAPFSGLTNTDLRPRRKRRRRPVPLLNTAWLASRRLRKGRQMLHELSPLFETLQKSVIEISASGAENSEALLRKSLDEFQSTMISHLEPILPAPYEPLAKGLNHIAMFANTLRDVERSITAIKTGRPAWMSSPEGMPEEKVPAEVADQMDRFLDVGVLTLRTMVNDAAELPMDDADLERAEAVGALAKIESEDGAPEVWVKTELPEDYRDFLIHPVDLLAKSAEMGRFFYNTAQAIAEPLDANGMLPDSFIDAFPELFKLDDEDIGTGGDPDANADPGDAAGDLTDDATMPDWTIVARMAAAMVST